MPQLQRVLRTLRIRRVRRGADALRICPRGRDHRGAGMDRGRETRRHRQAREFLPLRHRFPHRRRIQVPSCRPPIPSRLPASNPRSNRVRLIRTPLARPALKTLPWHHPRLGLRYRQCLPPRLPSRRRRSPRHAVQLGLAVCRLAVCRLVVCRLVELPPTLRPWQLRRREQQFPRWLGTRQARRGRMVRRAICGGPRWAR
jgi:hypothetical protein